MAQQLKKTKELSNIIATQFFVQSNFFSSLVQGSSINIC